MAFLISAMATGTFSEYKHISLPANKALTSTTPGGKFADTPFMFKASVIISPLKFNLFFNKSVTIAFEIDAAEFFVLSYAGTKRCATIILDKPRSINSLNGYNSKLSNSSLLRFNLGKVK